MDVAGHGAEETTGDADTAGNGVQLGVGDLTGLDVVTHYFAHPSFVWIFSKDVGQAATKRSDHSRSGPVEIDRRSENRCGAQM
ncbi:hypothetical protein GCM10010507_53950 [Streptomyces cinnamoneus]|uniref:Uncharacterized protein n=1 Tax=Streptomyces cinnamoneus TaxID=53446 RepID=A0A918WRI8_STRCJ|nr:hypothetical protein GCM10010507_53950 [Streptomyces cinnamoneus]